MIRCEEGREGGKEGERERTVCYCPLQGISTEESKLDPWTNVAKYKLKAEQALATIPGCVLLYCLTCIQLLHADSFCRLNYVVVRPALIYGVADKQGISKLSPPPSLLFSLFIPHTLHPSHSSSLTLFTPHTLHLSHSLPLTLFTPHTLHPSQPQD